MSRPTCPRCERPQITCLCAWVRATPNRVRVLVLQHPHEVGEAKGSATLLQLSLAQVRVAVGEVFEATALAAWLGAAGESVLLYPETLANLAGSPDPQQPRATPNPATTRTTTHSAPPQLVVLDATWKKSLRMLAHNPLLLALPRLPLIDTGPSAYGLLRRAPKPGQLSTLEATCHALQALESAADWDAATRYAPLLQAFDGWLAERVARSGHVVTSPRG
jgi:DTW domain-containing protein YfiP